MSEITKGDTQYYLALLCAKGFVNEVRCKDGIIRYEAKKLKNLIIRCMDCDFLTYDIEDSLKHSEKSNHYSDVNIYKQKQRKMLLKEIYG